MATVSDRLYCVYVRRYKLLDPALWPKHRMKDRAAVRHLVNHYQLQNMVKYGKTMLFIRTSMTMYFLENVRTNMLPPVVSKTMRTVYWWVWLNQPEGVALNGGCGLP